MDPASGGSGGAANMPKKKSEYSVLSEVNTEDEWLQLCKKEGLVVVDVYSDWSGPCSAMTNFLKKMKLEVNDDLLSYAMAKTDGIPQLKIFQGFCKPIWLFIASGLPVAVCHGANAPLLGRMIQSEMQKERMVMSGEKERQTIEFSDALPKSSTSMSDDDDSLGGGEQKQHDALKDIKMEQEEEVPQRREWARFAIMLVEQSVVSNDEHIKIVKECLKTSGLEVMQEKEVMLSEANMEAFVSGSDSHQSNKGVDTLLGTPCTLLHLRCENESEGAIPLLNKLLGPPGVDKAGADDSLRKRVLKDDEIGFLCPSYEGFLSLREEHFLDAQRETDVQADSNCYMLPNPVLVVFKATEQEEILSAVEESGVDVLGQTNAETSNIIEVIEMLKEEQSREGEGDHQDSEATKRLEFLETDESMYQGCSLLALLLHSSTDSEAAAAAVDDLLLEDIRFAEELRPLIRTRNDDAVRAFFPNMRAKVTEAEAEAEAGEEEEEEEEEGAGGRQELGGLLEVVMTQDEKDRSKKSNGEEGK